MQQQVNPTIKSYADRAVIALVLYLFGWFPGVVANLIWLFDAQEYQKRTGVKPMGETALWWMLWIFGIGWIIVLVLAVVLIGTTAGLIARP